MKYEVTNNMEKTRFIDKISNLICRDELDLFVGSGISKPSGIPVWDELLKPLADEIGLDISLDDNLPLVAQYILNSNSGNRNILNMLIVENFEKDYPLNPYHYEIAKMKVNTIWTTNYDCLLQKAFSGKNFAVKSTDNDLTKPHLPQNIEIIKIHGCVKNGDFKQLIITQEDYDDFAFTKPVITQRLRDVLLQKSFLFIGYRYKDINIRNIMIEAMRLSRSNVREHFIILKKPFDIDCNDYIKFDCWCSELNRIGIRTHVVDDFDEITDILRKINYRTKENNIYVTGSHERDSSEYAKRIGESLADINDIILVNGQSDGVASIVLSSFMSCLIEKRYELSNRIKLYPNPYSSNPEYSNDVSLLPQLKKERSFLLSNTKIVLVFPGGVGTIAEIEVAMENDCIILPIIENLIDYDNSSIQFLLSKNSITNYIKNNIPKYWECIYKREIIPHDFITTCIKDLITT